ncbi:MAG: NUDIX hydrolase [Chloroflexota bacterium]|nr:NUDIX hydrolase [Chloroflexota bacterium]
MTGWKKLAEEFSRFGYRSLIKRIYQLPNGNLAEFNLIDGGPVVCILPLTSDNRVILAQQFRPGPEKVLMELPAGGVEKDETPEAAARRELLEETGYDGNFQFIGTSFVLGYSTMLRYNFVVTNCRKVQEQKTDEGEFIEVVEMPLVKFRDHLRSGELTNATTGYLGLDFLKLL